MGFLCVYFINPPLTVIGHIEKEVAKMDSRKKVIRGITFSMLFTAAAVISLLLFTGTAFADQPLHQIGGPTGGSCNEIGVWNAADSTCQLTRDVNSLFITGIVVVSDGVTIDGNGYSLSGIDTLSGEYGIVLKDVSRVTIKNLKINGFDSNILIQGTNPYLSTSNEIKNNLISGGQTGINIFGSTSSNSIHANEISNCSSYGISIWGDARTSWISANDFHHNGVGIKISAINGYIESNSLHDNTEGIKLDWASNVTVFKNDFRNNNLDAMNTNDISTTPNSFHYGGLGNFWDEYSAPTLGCGNQSPFDLNCDQSYSFAGALDEHPASFPAAWRRFDWTWYDNIGGDNWVLLGNSTESGQTTYMKLDIGGVARPVSASPTVPNITKIYPGETQVINYDSLRAGPVIATPLGWNSENLNLIASQRILWPKGGSSLEEVVGTEASRMSSNFYWPWYDMKSPGFQNWVMVENPNQFRVNYMVLIAGWPHIRGTIEPNSYVSPAFPNIQGGPVEVRALDSNGQKVKVLASQRVLTNGGNSFNEVPGIPLEEVGADYLWPYYDNKNGTNWIMISNPFGNDIYYKVTVSGIDGAMGTASRTGGPIPPNSSRSEIIPNLMGGPVEVKTYSDANLSIPSNSIVSQRTLWGPSFEEVPGSNRSLLKSSYIWTWYDMKSPGAMNWVMLTNTMPDEVEYEIKIAGTVQATGIIPSISDPYPSVYWTKPGYMGGPVEVRAWKLNDNGTRSAEACNILVSQRVLWNGHFNEVLGSTG